MFFNFYFRDNSNSRDSILNDITETFLLRHKEASDGMLLLNRFIDTNDSKGLSNLLRHHDEKTITNKETFQRDNVDFFIRYFSMVCVAYLTGSIKHYDLKRIQVEIAFYLGNVAVKRYYTENYPLLLPQILLEVALTDRPFPFYNDRQGADSIQHLNMFLQLNQQIENEDVYQLLWFLDGGENDDSDITDVNKLLRNPQRMIEFLQDEDEDTALHESLRGFFDYLTFMEDFTNFLNSIDNEFDRSVFWHYHSYWFLKLKQESIKSIGSFFTGIKNFETNNKRELLLEVTYMQRKESAYAKIVSDLTGDNIYKSPLEKFYQEWRFNPLRNRKQ